MPVREPYFGLNYGKAKAGKTCEMIYSFPTGKFIAAEGALKSSTGVVGIELGADQLVRARTIMEATDAIKAEGKKEPKRRAASYTVDDFSLVTEETVLELEKTYDGYKLWGQVRNNLLRFRQEARRVGIHVILNCHERPPSTDDSGGPLRGGPRLPGKMVEDMPAMCDGVFRVEAFQAASESALVSYWPVVLRNDVSSDYIMGGRESVMIDPLPFNTAEYLRFSGHLVSRWKEIASWQEEAVEKVAGIFVKYELETVKLIEQAENYVRKHWTKEPAFVRWTVRDGLARSQLRRAMTRYNKRPPIFGIAE